MKKLRGDLLMMGQTISKRRWVYQAQPVEIYSHRAQLATPVIGACIALRNIMWRTQQQCPIIARCLFSPFPFPLLRSCNLSYVPMLCSWTHFFMFTWLNMILFAGMCVNLLLLTHKCNHSHCDKQNFHFYFTLFTYTSWQNILLSKLLRPLQNRYIRCTVLVNHIHFVITKLTGIHTLHFVFHQLVMKSGSFVTDLISWYQNHGTNSFSGLPAVTFLIQQLSLLSSTLITSCGVIQPSLASSLLSWDNVTA